MVKTQEITDKKVWGSFVLDRPEANFLQSWNWGEFHKNLGHEIERVGFWEDEKLLGVMLAIVERAKRGTYLTVPGGPLIDWENGKLVSEFKKTIEGMAEKYKCVFVRVRPQTLETSENSRLFSDLGFRNAPMHLHAELTNWLDITKTEEELLAGMRKATRYEIKQAQKLGIKITSSQDSADMDEFYDLQMETARRHKFVPFGREFLKEQFRVFAADNQAVLYTAWQDSVKLAYAMVIFYGQEANYHYGAGSQEGRKYPGAYLIQWEAIKEAKKREIKRYNFWGVAPEGEESHRFYGVSVFKRGFGGQDVAYLHARDLVIDWPRYFGNWAIESFRRRTRRV